MNVWGVTYSREQDGARHFRCGQLIDLGDCVAGAASTEVCIDPLGPVFISYRQSDGTELANRLMWQLRAAGVPVWRDHADLLPGDTNKRLGEALASGLSGAVLIVTPDVAKSTVVKTVEVPALIELEGNPDFVFSIANAIRHSGGLDYKAPERLLEQPEGSLARLLQSPVDSSTAVLKIVRHIVEHRMTRLQGRVAANHRVLHLNIQTRNDGQAHDRSGAELDLRLRPGSHPRLPSIEGLADFAASATLLPAAATRAGARQMMVSGGAHLSVAFALGTVLPSSRLGSVHVLDQRGVLWRSGAESSPPAGKPSLKVCARSKGPASARTGRQKVLLYLDLMSPRNDGAFERFLVEQGRSFAVRIHARSTNEILIDPADAGAIAAEAAYLIREISSTHGSAEVHLLYRGPFAMPVLIGRLTNTVRTVVYEWAEMQGPGEGPPEPRYVAALGCSPSDPVTPVEVLLGASDGIEPAESKPRSFTAPMDKLKRMFRKDRR